VNLRIDLDLSNELVETLIGPITFSKFGIFSIKHEKSYPFFRLGDTL